MCFSFADKKWDYRWGWGELYGQRLKLHALLQSLVQPNLDSNCAHRWSPCPLNSWVLRWVTWLSEFEKTIFSKRNNFFEQGHYLGWKRCHFSLKVFFLSLSCWVESLDLSNLKWQLFWGKYYLEWKNVTFHPQFWIKSHHLYKKSFELSHVTYLTIQESKLHGDHLIVVLVFCNAMIFIELRKSRKDMASSRQVFNNQHQNGTTVLHTGLAQLIYNNLINLNN